MDGNDGIYQDVSDNEILEIVDIYPQILDGSNMLMSRYKAIMQLFQFDRDIINDTTFNEVPIC
jgi:hypothetical protein